MSLAQALTLFAGCGCSPTQRGSMRTRQYGGRWLGGQIEVLKLHGPCQVVVGRLPDTDPVRYRRLSVRRIAPLWPQRQGQAIDTSGHQTIFTTLLCPHSPASHEPARGTQASIIAQTYAVLLRRLERRCKRKHTCKTSHPSPRARLVLITRTYIPRVPPDIGDKTVCSPKKLAL